MKMFFKYSTLKTLEDFQINFKCVNKLLLYEYRENVIDI